MLAIAGALALIFVTPAGVVTVLPGTETPSEHQAAAVPDHDRTGLLPRLGRTEGLHVDAENDAFAFLPSSEITDRYYTHGTHFNMLLQSDPPGFLRRLARWPLQTEAGGADLRWGWGFGQNIYTSENILDTEPRDRPYAGLAYGSVNLISVSDDQLNTLELQLGLVGPSAQAWFSQDERHRQIPIAQAEGWKYQIKDEPGGSLQWERRWRVRAWRPAAEWNAGRRLPQIQFDRTDFIGAEVGTFRTNFSGGMLFRAGINVDQDFGPPRSWPAPNTASYVESRGWWELYAFAGVDLRVIVRDITLDGNTFQDSPRIDKLYFVPELVGGVGFRIMNVRASYMHVFRYPEFDGQNQEQSFGRWSLTYAHALY